MSTILAHILVVDGKEAAFEEVAATLFAASHANETSLRAYGYWRAQAPRTYYALLAFDDYLGFLAHQTSTHHEDAAARLRECIESMTLEWVDPLADASTLAPTDPQELPTDASELMIAYARRIPAQVAPWWQPLRLFRGGRR